MNIKEEKEKILNHIKSLTHEELIEELKECGYGQYSNEDMGEDAFFITDMIQDREDYEFIKSFAEDVFKNIDNMKLYWNGVSYIDELQHFSKTNETWIDDNNSEISDITKLNSNLMLINILCSLTKKLDDTLELNPCADGSIDFTFKPVNYYNEEFNKKERYHRGLIKINNVGYQCFLCIIHFDDKNRIHSEDILEVKKPLSVTDINSKEFKTLVSFIDNNFTVNSKTI